MKELKMSNFALRGNVGLRQLEDLSMDGQGVRSFSDMKAEAVMLTLLCFLVSVLILFTILSIREYLWMGHQISCCRRNPRRPNAQMDVARNTTTANADQEQVNNPSHSDSSRSEENRAITIQEKRIKRRSWYEYYLKKFTHVVTEKDFVDEHGDHPRADLGSPASFDSAKSITVECGNGSHRIVDGSCSICICEYEVGEKIVRSPLDDCVHVYHEECMLQWLSKGKKRCPICRHWFVSGARIADQISAEFGDDADEDVINV